MRDGGLLTFCALTNKAASGDMPKMELSPVISGYFSRVQTGITRLYAALGADRRYDLVVRVWNFAFVPSGAEYVVLPNNEQYQIDLWRQIIDEDALELTLIKVDSNYDVDEQNTESP